MANPVRVFCNVPNGLTLRLFKPFADGTGMSQMVPFGEPVTIGGPRSPQHDNLAPAEQYVATDIDPQFWAAWLKQNDGSDLLSSRGLYAEEEKREEAKE